MSERNDAMASRSCLGTLACVLGVLEVLPRMLVPGQVILFSLLLGNAMGKAAGAAAVAERAVRKR
jgi:hypothetical protein